MIKNKILFFILLIFSFSFIYSATITFTPEDSTQQDLLVSAYYIKNNCEPSSSNSCPEVGNLIFIDKSLTYANSQNYNPTDTSPVWKRFFFYKKNYRIEPYARYDFGSNIGAQIIYI